MRMLLIVISFVSFSCATKSVNSAEDLELYASDDRHGLKQVEEIDSYKVEVCYRPTDLMVAKDISRADSTNESYVLELKKKYKPYAYFVVKLSRDNKEALHNITGDRTQYSELVQTLSFEMPEYVTLTTNTNDTIPVADFVLNRTYGLSASTDLLFAFNNEKIENLEWVQFNLNEFGMGMGNLRFRFDTSDIRNTPSLDFKTLVIK